MSKQLLLGDEAIAQAALDAGLSGVYAYPGTPSSLHEARWHERGGRLLRQLCRHRRKGRIDRGGCRRPQHALFSKRTGQPFLWRFRTDTYV